MLPVLAAIALSVPTTPYTWRNIEIVGGGFVTGIIPHPKTRDLVYARTDIGGAYRWNPRTSRWVPLMDWITRPDWNLYGVESVGLDPNDPNRLYIAAGTYNNKWGEAGAILSSSDRGRTFHRFDLPFKNGGNMPGRSMGERLAVDPRDGRNIWFGSRDAGLWRSRDYGRTWSAVSSFPDVKARRPADDVEVWKHPLPEGQGVSVVVFQGGTIYAGVARQENNLFRSTDDGKTWKPVPGHPQGLIPHQAKFAAGALFVAFGDAPGPNDVSNGAVWRFDTRKGQWTDITPDKPGPGNTFGYGGVAVSGDTVMVSTLSRWSKGDDVFRSTDGGKTWISLKAKTKRDARRAPYLLWARPEPEFGHWIGDVEIDPHNPDCAWYVTGATIWGTSNLRNADRDLPTFWHPRAEGLEETAVLDLVSPPQGAHVVSALGDIAGFAHFDLRRSPPGGMWTNPTLVTTSDLDYAGLRPSLFLRVGRTHGRAPQNGAISRDGGRTWTPLKHDVPGRTDSGTAAISADGKTIVWAPRGPVPHVTTDFGATWTPCAGLATGGAIVSDKTDPRRFYYLHEQTLFVSRDGGRSFAQAAEGLPEEAGRLVSIEGRPGWLLLPGQKDGLWRSVDGGASFRRLGSVQEAEQVGVGKPQPGTTEPTLFLNGTIDGVIGVFRSTDSGRNWTRINDKATGFGTMNVITGDPKRFGRVYLGTNGRGVLVGDPR